MRGLAPWSLLAFAALVAPACAQARTHTKAPTDTPADRAGLPRLVRLRRRFRWASHACVWRPDSLANIKSEFDNTARLAPARAALLARAQSALARKNHCVVDKTHVPASSNKHDYMSMGPYWWPDPQSKDGLPYIRRDGHFNPERDSDAFDVSDLGDMSQDVQALSLAYYFTGEKRYALKAGELLRVWFLIQPRA